MGLDFDTGRLKQNNKRKIKGPADLSHSYLLLSSFMPFLPQAMSNPGLLTSGVKLRTVTPGLATPQKYMSTVLK